MVPAESSRLEDVLPPDLPPRIALKSEVVGDGGGKTKGKYFAERRRFCLGHF